MAHADAAGNQVSAAVDMDEDGDFIITWVENANVFARKFNTSGIAQPIAGNTAGTLISKNDGTNFTPAIAMDADGDFVVVWEGQTNYIDTYGNDSSKPAIYMRRYTKAGVASGADEKIYEGPRSFSDTSRPTVAMDQDGDFVVAWEVNGYNPNSYISQGLFARRYNNTGIAQGNVFPVDVTNATRGIKTSASIAMDAAGNFAIVWQSDFEDTESNSGVDVFIARFNADGTRLNETGNTVAEKINTQWSGVEIYNEKPSIAMDNAGNYTIVWYSRSSGKPHPLDGSCGGIIAKRYNNQGQPLTNELLVNLYTKGVQENPAIGMSATGDFAVAWRSGGDCGDGNQNGQTGIFNRLYLLPTNVSLSAATIAENSLIGTAIGVFTTTDATPGDNHTYTLVTGTGNTDNASFTISGNELRTSTVFNFETRKTGGYSIRVRATDTGGMYVEKTFLVNVTDLNEAPNNITLSANTIFENKPVATLIGNFTTTDPDATDTQHSYTLVTGSGDTDNASFIISGNQLTSNSIFDFETKSNFSIRVRATDAGGLSFEKVFPIVVTNFNDTPTLNAIPALQIQESDPQQSVPLSGITSGGETGQVLTVTATADKPELLTGLAITYTSPNATGTLRFKPIAGKTGSVVITVRVADNGGTANGAVNFVERSFRVDILGLPKAPTRITATVNAESPQTRVDLTWIKAEQAAGYRIQVSVGDDSNFTFIEEGLTGENTTNFSHTSNSTPAVQPGTRYFYRIIAYNSAGDSPPSEVVGVITAGPIVTGMESQEKTDALKLYPNPTAGKLTVDATELGILPGKKGILAIYNLLGEAIYSEEFATGNPLTLQLSSWPAGRYVLVFTAGDLRIVKQVIKY